MTEHTRRPSRARKMPRHLRALRSTSMGIAYEVDYLTEGMGFKSSPYQNRNPRANSQKTEESLICMRRLLLEAWALLEEIEP